MPFKINPTTSELDYYLASLTGAEIVTLLEALGAGSRLSHTKLDDIGASDHHTKYTDEEARAACALIGSIIAWAGGYFTNGANGGFTSVLGNTIAAANAYLNPKGWYVCDGAELNLPDSPIFDGAGRYLPNLTDDRFLMGSTVAGGIGGSSTMAHTHPVTSNVAVANHAALALSNHATLVLANHVFTQPTAHGIVQPGFNGPSHRHDIEGVNGAWNAAGAYVVSTRSSGAQMCTATVGSGTTKRLVNRTVYGGIIACTRTQDVALSNNHNGGAVDAHSFTQNIDAHSFAQNIDAHDVTNNAVTSGAASNTENRPKYLSCFYIMRVI